ncbi:hypothetical protein [Prosthecobacter sp.]
MEIASFRDKVLRKFMRPFATLWRNLRAPMRSRSMTTPHLMTLKERAG